MIMHAKMPIVRESPTAKTVWASGEFTLTQREADDGPSTFVLAPSSDRPAAASLERLEHAYALRDELDPDWAARPLSYSARFWELTIEDPGGIILGSLVGGPWELRPFLRVAIGLASSLRRLHDRGLVHRDLSPSNLFVDINTGRVWLSGFGLASRVPRQRQTPEPPESIAGTLASQGVMKHSAIAQSSRPAPSSSPTAVF